MVSSKLGAASSTNHALFVINQFYWVGRKRIFSLSALATSVLMTYVSLLSLSNTCEMAGGITKPVIQILYSGVNPAACQVQAHQNLEEHKHSPAGLHQTAITQQPTGCFQQAVKLSIQP